VCFRKPSILSALCFHILTNPFSRNSLVFTTIRIAQGCGVFLFLDVHESQVTQPQVTHFHGIAASFASLGPLFRNLSLYFQQLAASFCKTPGVGGTLGRTARLPIPY